MYQFDVDAKNVLKELLHEMLHTLGFNELKLVKWEIPAADYLKFFEMLKSGEGIYYIDSGYCSQGAWLHIGSKTSSSFEIYGDGFIELFWRTLRHVLWILYNSTEITITMMTEETEQNIELNIEPSRRMVYFDMCATLTNFKVGKAQRGL